MYPGHHLPTPGTSTHLQGSWAASLLSFGAALGIVFGLAAAQPAKAITAEQFSQLTYAQAAGRWDAGCWMER